MKRKQLGVVFLAAAMLVMTAGCGSSSAPSTYETGGTSGGSQTQTQSSAKQESAGTTTESEEQAEEAADNDAAPQFSEDYLDLRLFPKFQMFSFVNGGGHIKLEIGNDYSYVLVDRAGNMLADFGEDYHKRAHGSGVFYTESEVVDTAGNTVFTAAEGQKVLIVGDEWILVYEEPSGFETAEARVGIVDFDGNWVCPLSSDYTLIDDDKLGLVHGNLGKVGYLGEGIFGITGDQWWQTSALDATTGNSWIVGDDPSPYSPSLKGENHKIYGVPRCMFYEGKAIFGAGDGSGHDVLVDKNGTVLQEIHAPHTSWPAYLSDPLGEGRYLLYSTQASDEEFCHLCDYDGNVIADLSEYQDFKCRGYVKGYAICLMTGADQKKYFTIMDKNGNFLFDPRKEDDYPYNNGGPEGMVDVENNAIFFRDRSFSLQDGSILYDYSEPQVVGYGGLESGRESDIDVKDMDGIAIFHADGNDEKYFVDRAVSACAQAGA